MIPTISSDAKCPSCGRWASEHAKPSPLCDQSEVQVLRIKIGELQHSVSYLFTLRDPQRTELQ
jgi:hypothetical protein